MNRPARRLTARSEEFIGRLRCRGRPYFLFVNPPIRRRVGGAPRAPRRQSLLPRGQRTRASRRPRLIFGAIGIAPIISSITGMFAPSRQHLASMTLGEDTTWLRVDAGVPYAAQRPHMCRPPRQLSVRASDEFSEPDGSGAGALPMAPKLSGGSLRRSAYARSAGGSGRRRGPAGLPDPYLRQAGRLKQHRRRLLRLLPRS